jgi:5-(aminomethyl)-3-furanmethanol phosphate kinase
MSLRVLKLGGSLLDMPQLAEVFGEWLARQPPLANLMLVGGGSLADSIRAADRTHGLGEAASHALCLEVLGVTAALGREIFAHAQLCTRVDQIDRRPSAALQIFDVRDFLRRQPTVDRDGTHNAECLPATWQVTSDSIAAHLARAVDAEELVLLKSALPDSGPTAVELADSGFVDEFFPRALGRQSLRIVNLREPWFAERVAAGAEAPARADKK